MSIALQESSTFAGRYRVLRCIATGAMGAVYEVVHIETDRRRALKVMLPHVAESRELRDRFRLEARIAAQVESEFIVEVFDAGVDEATSMPFLVMELLRGEELGKRLKRLGRFSAEEVVTYLQQTAMALDRTHKASIVHRDLKPANLFLTQRDDGAPRIKVLDFGVAKLLQDAAANMGATANIGTPLYMAPEQLTGANVSPATDLYALGMIAYALLVGHEYWFEETRRSEGFIPFAMITVNGPVEPATARAARRGVTLPPAFDAWFSRATAAAPAARFTSAAEAIDALARALEVSPPSAVTAARSGVTPAVQTVVENDARGLGSIGAASMTRAPTRRTGRTALLIGGVAAPLVLLVVILTSRSGSGPTAAVQTSPVTGTSAMSAASPATAAFAPTAPPSAAPAPTNAGVPPPGTSSASAPLPRPAPPSPARRPSAETRRPERYDPD